jgi:hypothetical protein
MYAQSVLLYKKTLACLLWQKHCHKLTVAVVAFLAAQVLQQPLSRGLMLEL